MSQSIDIDPVLSNPVYWMAYKMLENKIGGEGDDDASSWFGVIEAFSDTELDAFIQAATEEKDKRNESAETTETTESADSI
jgi:hypothetical protein